MNVAPELGSVGSRSVNEEATLAFTVTATDHDNPPHALTFSLDAASSNAGMTITPGGAFSWTPTEMQGGASYSATIKVTDNGDNAANLFDTETIAITVNEVNVAPVLAAIPSQSVNRGATLTFTVSATDQDRNPAQVLTYSLSGAPSGAEMDPHTGVFAWAPTDEQAQLDYSFIVTVTDDGANPAAQSDSQTVTISAVAAVQDCAGFRSPSTNMVVSNTFAYAAGETLQALTWTPDLAGWTLNTVGRGVAFRQRRQGRFPPVR